ncbi:hypothetical protein IJG89_04180 [Candidatus Saccharibacteria bacterium]|nr:hypothetical protein [Candidatus Saccharibacteria bacterium]
MSKKTFSVLFPLIVVPFFSFLFAPRTSALTYQDYLDVRFTFNSSIILNLSSENLTIYNLTPGTSADSNIINVTATSNNSTGYVITATVGNGTHSAPSYNNTSLNHSNGTDTFSSVATSANLASLSTDNTWGYSLSTDNGSTWSNYSGLPIYTAASGKELFSTNTNGTNTIKFKIGAKASASQPSGEYTNVINFTVTSNAVDNTLYMQDVATWGSTVTAGNEVEAVDNRDGKTYTVARLADGNLWMTQNLDFDIVDGGADLDDSNTDVPSNWADAGNLTDTYAANDTTWDGYTDQPESYDPGDLCWNGTIAPDYSGTLSTYAEACGSDKHYHIGNYYNWTAAVAMADSSSYTTDNTDVNQSICPAGWTLPKSGSNTSSGSFAYLVNQASLTSGTSGNIHTSPYYFVYGGYWYGSSYDVGGYGYYWSSVVYVDYAAYHLYFTRDGDLYPDGDDDRGGGVSVRCVAR